MSAFFDRLGEVALGSRLRILCDRLTAEADEVYGLYQVGLRPKWFPVFHALSEGDEKSVTDIAVEIGHSHPSVSKIIREMAAAEIVQEQKDPKDKRRNVISLTEKGRRMVIDMRPQYQDVRKATEDLLTQTTHNLWHAMVEFEYLLTEKSLSERVNAQKKVRESKQVEIVDFQPAYRAAFRALNEEWIIQYFKMEEADYKALDQPERILEQGGHIVVALYDGEPVGVCALLKMDDPDYDYELAKMAVSPKAQGKGVGYLLGKAMIDKGKEQGAKKLYLESNTILTPAINLYRKLGFTKVSGRPTPYERCNIQMELTL